MLILPTRVKACLAHQRFQENDALRPDWRLVLVPQAIPRLPKITLEGPIMRLFILSSGLSISVLIRKASAPTHRWRPSLLKLLMVASNYDTDFKLLEASYRCWYRCATLATKYFGSYVKGVEDIMFWRNPFGGVKVSRTRKEFKLIQEVQTICKLLAVNPATSTAGEASFSSVPCLKTWLRCRMADERFSNLEVLNGHRSFFR